MEVIEKQHLEQQSNEQRQTIKVSVVSQPRSTLTARQKKWINTLPVLNRSEWSSPCPKLLGIEVRNKQTWNEKKRFYLKITTSILMHHFGDYSNITTTWAAKCKMKNATREKWNGRCLMQICYTLGEICNVIHEIYSIKCKKRDITVKITWNNKIIHNMSSIIKSFCWTQRLI